MKYALYNGILLDGTREMQPLENQMVLINGSKIEKIVPLVPAARLHPSMIHKAYPSYELVDLKGQYLLPGLINLHTHLPASGIPRRRSGNPAGLVKLVMSNPFTRFILEKVCEKNSRTALMSGVTTLRCVGGVGHLDTHLRDRIRDGFTLGPRILTSDYAISVEGGHMTGSVARAAHSPEEAVSMVRELSTHHPDLIKLMVTGGVGDSKIPGEPGQLRMDPSIIKAACDKAHEMGFYVAAHVQSTEGLKQALRNGVDSIEHGAEPTEEIITLFKEREAALVATFSPAVPYAYVDPAVSRASDLVRQNSDVVFEGMIRCATKCVEEGIPVGLGTDASCPFVTHYDMWREVAYFAKFCHMSRSFALYTATLGNAKIAGIEDRTGSVERGKSADLIVVEKNPLEDLSALRGVTMVMVRGRMIRKPKVKRIKKIDEALDPILK